MRDSFYETQKNYQQDKPDILLGVAAAVGIGVAAYAIDRLKGTQESVDYTINPEFYTDSHPSRQDTLGVFPGCQMNGKAVFNRFQPLTAENNTNLIMASYPEKGFSVEAVCEGMAKELLKVRAEKPSLICQSMGGIVARHFLEYAKETGLSDEIGGFGTIVLDSSPFHDLDIRDKYVSQLKLATKFQNSFTVNHLKPYFMKRNHEWSAKTPLTAVAGQGNFMGADHPPGPAPDIFDRVVYVRGKSADPVIKTRSAAEKYSRIFRNNFEVVIDKQRPEDTHTAFNDQQLNFLLAQAGVLKPYDEPASLALRQVA